MACCHSHSHGANILLQNRCPTFQESTCCLRNTRKCVPSLNRCGEVGQEAGALVSCAPSLLGAFVDNYCVFAFLFSSSRGAVAVAHLWQSCDKQERALIGRRLLQVCRTSAAAVMAAGRLKMCINAPTSRKRAALLAGMRRWGGHELPVILHCSDLVDPWQACMVDRRHVVGVQLRNWLLNVGQEHRLSEWLNSMPRATAFAAVNCESLCCWPVEPPRVSPVLRVTDVRVAYSTLSRPSATKNVFMPRYIPVLFRNTRTLALYLPSSDFTLILCHRGCSSPELDTLPHVERLWTNGGLSIHPPLPNEPELLPCLQHIVCGSARLSHMPPRVATIRAKGLIHVKQTLSTWNLTQLHAGMLRLEAAKHTTPPPPVQQLVVDNVSMKGHEAAWAQRCKQAFARECLHVNEYSRPTIQWWVRCMHPDTTCPQLVFDEELYVKAGVELALANLPASATSLAVYLAVPSMHQEQQVEQEQELPSNSADPNPRSSSQALANLRAHIYGALSSLARGRPGLFWNLPSKGMVLGRKCLHARLHTDTDTEEGTASLCYVMYTLTRV